MTSRTPSTTRQPHAPQRHAADAAQSASGQAPTDAAQQSSPAGPPVHRHAVLKYTGMRVGLFAVALGLLILVPVRGVLLVALALIISGLASYVLLGPQRQAMSAELFAARERRRAKAAARAAREDHLQPAHDDADGSAS